MELKIVHRYFDLIHKIQLKDSYSDAELNFLIKELEKVKGEFHNLQRFIDLYYESEQFTKNGRIMSVMRFRIPFHRVLKDIGLDPLRN